MNTTNLEHAEFAAAAVSNAKHPSKLHALDAESWLDTVWDALHRYREEFIPESQLDHDDEWMNICSAMAYIREALNLPDLVDANVEGQ